MVALDWGKVVRTWKQVCGCSCCWCGRTDLYFRAARCLLVGRRSDFAPARSFSWPQRASSTWASPPKVVSSWAGKCPSPPRWSARPPAVPLAAAGSARSRPLSMAGRVRVHPLPGVLLAAKWALGCPPSGLLAAAVPRASARPRPWSRPPTAAPQAHESCLSSRGVASCHACPRRLSSPLVVSCRARARRSSRCFVAAPRLRACRLPYGVAATCVARARSEPLATASRAHARAYPRPWPLAAASQSLAGRLPGSRACCRCFAQHRVALMPGLASCPRL